LFERVPISRFFKAGLCSIVLVIFDYFMEPVAIKHDFWSWQDGNIPYQNYVGWFATSFLICFLFQFTVWPKRNRVAGVVFLIQFAFFLVQNIL